MKIKIPPYPDLTITDEAFERDVDRKAVVKSNSAGLTNQLVLVIEFESGEKRVLKARPVKYQNKLFVTAFPNPVHLFLSAAVEFYDYSEKIKETNFMKCGIEYGDNVYLLQVEASGTHDCYNDYIKYRVSSIIMLVSSIEAFLNHVIPNDFVYEVIRNKKPAKLTKQDIESAKVSFNEKLLKIIPQYLKSEEFWNNHLKEKDYLLDLYENRKNMIHLKTNSEDDLERYFKAIDKMLDLDIFASIDSCIKFMNSVSSNFIEYKSGNNI